MARITQKELNGAFDLFLRTIDGRRAASYKDVGGYSLDHINSQGWQIQRVVNEHGGVTCPYGHTLRNTVEMYYTLHFAVNVLEEMDREGKVTL